MRLSALAGLVAVGAAAALADEPVLTVDLLAGHPIHDEAAAAAGVVMALSITSAAGAGEGAFTTRLEALCEELSAAAGLADELAVRLPLTVVFIVPWKAMAVEGYYLPADGREGGERLVPGGAVARATLDRIVAAVGIPPSVLDEAEVEHEVSCECDRPAWHLRWADVRAIGAETPEAVIDRARRRFLAIHQSIVEEAMALPGFAKM